MSTVKCISPIDGSLFAERPCLSQNQAFAATERARAAQADWARRPLQERIDLVRAGVAAIGAMNDEIVPELAHQMGRPIRYGGEFGGFNERASYMADIAASALAPTQIEDSDNFRRLIKRVPHGVVLVVAPWNYPYMTAINTVAPALIAGNTVVLKHASQTLLVGERMAAAFQAAGIPEAVFQNVFLDHATTSALIAANSFGFVNFTGSVSGGRAMEHAAAGTFTGLGQFGNAPRTKADCGGIGPVCSECHRAMLSSYDRIWGGSDCEIRSGTAHRRGQCLCTRSNTTPDQDSHTGW